MKSIKKYFLITIFLILFVLLSFTNQILDLIQSNLIRTSIEVCLIGVSVIVIIVMIVKDLKEFSVSKDLSSRIIILADFMEVFILIGLIVFYFMPYDKNNHDLTFERMIISNRIIMIAGVIGVAKGFVESIRDRKKEEIAEYESLKAEKETLED